MEGGGIRAAAGDADEGRRDQRDVVGVSQRFADCRVAGERGDDPGFLAVSLLLVDEASRVPDELYMAVRPMLAASSGALWLMSTPCGKRGFFWEAWERGGPEWERIRAPGNECGRIDRAFQNLATDEHG